MTDEKEDKKGRWGMIWYFFLGTAVILLALYWKLYIDIQTITTLFQPVLPKVAVTFITFFLVNLFLKATLPILHRAAIIYYKAEDWKVISKLYVYFVWLISIIIILTGIFGSFSSLGISLSVIGAGVAFALQQVILSFVGWFLIMTKRPYRIGDRIYVKKSDIQGDVEDINMLFTILKEVSPTEAVTGKNIIIPNSTVFLEPIINYSYDVPYIWIAIPVSITYESDLALAEKIIYHIAKEVAGESMRRGARMIRRKTPESVQVDHAREDPVMRVEFADSSIAVTVRVMCLPKEVRLFKTDIYRKVFYAFNDPENKDKVEIAYPHMELVLHDETMSDRVRDFLDGGKRSGP